MPKPARRVPRWLTVDLTILDALPIAHSKNKDAITDACLAVSLRGDGHGAG